jgi:hypothetical protein
MQAEVAEIERRLNVNILCLEVKEPTKGAKRENGESKSNQTKPNRPIFRQSIISFSYPRRLSQRRWG